VAEGAGCFSPGGLLVCVGERGRGDIGTFCGVSWEGGGLGVD
jgi:hypothetical protein